MSATATAIETADDRRTPQLRPSPQIVPSGVIDPDTESHAEHAVFRDATIGATIGAIVFAPIYAALVFVALLNRGTPLAPPILMAAGIGVLAGVFIGGWAGTLVGANTLEKFEREHRPKPSTLQPAEQSRG